jgi:cytochrome c biogenesis protein CcmG/thiol:disulfide interchange protein DsbE
LPLIQHNSQGNGYHRESVYHPMLNLTNKYFPLFASLVLLASAAWIFISEPEANTLQASQEAASVGFLAPNFTLTTMDGESVTLSDLRGHAVIINLWASWCLPCRAEMPAMQNVYDQYKESGLIILAVNASNQDNLASAQAFVDGLSLTYPILLDIEGKVSNLYNLLALPTTYFVNTEGIIEELVIGGPMAEALLSIRAEQLLGDLP